MRHARFLLLATVAAMALGGCANRTYFAEREKGAISVTIAGTPAEPVGALVGYKRQVVSIAPPKDTGGDAPSLISLFKVGYTTDTGPGDGAASTAIQIKNAYASGAAARAIAGDPEQVAALLGVTQGQVNVIDACINALQALPADQQQAAWGPVAAKLGMGSSPPGALRNMVDAGNPESVKTVTDALILAGQQVPACRLS